jgi:uridine kinase
MATGINSLVYRNTICTILSLMTYDQTRNIIVTFGNGRTRTFAYGIQVCQLIDEPEFGESRDSIVGGRVNNEVVSLTFKVEVNATFSPVTMDSPEGARIYRRSLCFLLTIAATELFPERRLVIGHSLGEGYFYYFDGEMETADAGVALLSKRMRELVAQDLGISRRVLSYADALKYLSEINHTSAEQLLEHRSDAKIPVYECAGFCDVAHGALVQSTGSLAHFDLVNYPPGFLLRYPATGQPGTIQPFKEQPIVFSIFQEYKRWGKVLEVSNAGQLNNLVRRGEIQDFIQVAEALHDRKISEIADGIAARRATVRLVLIAGPSSSGKTTFTKKLSVQLRVLGFNPVAVSVDDYFLSREQTPKDEDGEYDFETIDALDVELLNDHLCSLLGGEEVEIPEFDFKAGKPRSSGRKLRLERRNIVMIEGIHGLNRQLTHRIQPETKFPIYISALTQLNIDDHNRIPTTDVRLLRRMVRDHQFRGYSALDTLSRWPSVRKGELRNIFPHENNAVVAFNSSLDYELSVIKGYAEPLLRTIKPFHDMYGEAVRLMRFLSNFVMVTPKHVPSYSILREFIGDSGFEY